MDIREELILENVEQADRLIEKQPSRKKERKKERKKKKIIIKLKENKNVKSMGWSNQDTYFWSFI